MIEIIIILLILYLFYKIFKKLIILELYNPDIIDDNLIELMNEV